MCALVQGDLYQLVKVRLVSFQCQSVRGLDFTFVFHAKSLSRYLVLDLVPKMRVFRRDCNSEFCLPPSYPHLRVSQVVSDVLLRSS